MQETDRELTIYDLDNIARAPTMKDAMEYKIIVSKKFKDLKEELVNCKEQHATMCDMYNELKEENKKMKDIFKRNGMDKPVFEKEKDAGDKSS